MIMARCPALLPARICGQPRFPQPPASPAEPELLGPIGAGTSCCAVPAGSGAASHVQRTAPQRPVGLFGALGSLRAELLVTQPRGSF